MQVLGELTLTRNWLPTREAAPFRAEIKLHFIISLRFVFLKHPRDKYVVSHIQFSGKPLVPKVGAIASQWALNYSVEAKVDLQASRGLQFEGSL